MKCKASYNLRIFVLDRSDQTRSGYTRRPEQVSDLIFNLSLCSIHQNEPEIFLPLMKIIYTKSKFIYENYSRKCL